MSMFNKPSMREALNPWLFILGVNNSGTTLLARILETHPQIKALPHEGQFLTNALPHPEKENVVRLWTKKLKTFRWLDDDDPLPALKAKADWRLHYPSGPGYLLEKSPPNTIRSRWLQKNFVPSKFIAITRHPYAVCEGIQRRMGCSIEEAATHWKIATDYLMQDIPYLKQSFQFRYEDFVERPAHVAMQIQEFLGLEMPFDLSQFDIIASHSIEGQTVGLKNLNEKSYQKLSEADRAIINNICGEFMARCQYSSST
jgi:Sulfotransferase family